MFLTFMFGCVWQLLLNQHDDDDDGRVAYTVCSLQHNKPYTYRRTRLSTVGDRAFPAAAARLLNSLLSHFTAVLPISFHILLSFKSHLFSLSYPAFWLCRCTVYVVILDTVIAITFNV